MTDRSPNTDNTGSEGLGRAEILIRPEHPYGSRTYRCQVISVADGMLIGADVYEKLGSGTLQYRDERRWWGTSSIREVRFIRESKSGP